MSEKSPSKENDALSYANDLLKKAECEGFVWGTANDAAQKVSEELSEVKEAYEEKDANHLEEEVGDLLLAAVSLSRTLGVDAVAALQRAAKKFHDRFSYVEKCMEKNDIPFDSSHTAEMEQFWKEAKKIENSNKLNKSNTIII